MIIEPHSDIKLTNERTGDKRKISWEDICEYYGDLFRDNRQLAVSLGDPNKSGKTCLAIAQRICAEDWVNAQRRKWREELAEEAKSYKDQVENTLKEEVETYKDQALSRRGKKIIYNEDSLMAQRYRRLKREWKDEGKDTTATILYHGTGETNIETFTRNGFILPMSRGMLGTGIYLGQYEKAESFAGHDGLILKVRVMLGRCKELRGVEWIENLPGYDSLHLGAGHYPSVNKGYLKNEEWVIRNPDQIKIISFERNGHGRSWF